MSTLSLSFSRSETPEGGGGAAAWQTAGEAKPEMHK